MGSNVYITFLVTVFTLGFLTTDCQGAWAFAPAHQRQHHRVWVYYPHYPIYHQPVHLHRPLAVPFESKIETALRMHDYDLASRLFEEGSIPKIWSGVLTHTPLTIAVATFRNTPDPEKLRKLIDFILEKQGDESINERGRYGFTPFDWLSFRINTTKKALEDASPEERTQLRQKLLIMVDLLDVMASKGALPTTD